MLEVVVEPRKRTPETTEQGNLRRDRARKRYATDEEFRKRSIDSSRERYAADPAVGQRKKELARERYVAKPKKTHCKRGHDRTLPENLYGATCKTCVTERDRARYVPRPSPKLVKCKRGHDRTLPGAVNPGGTCKACATGSSTAYGRLHNTGWSQTDYDAAFKAQGGRCANCFREVTLHADHCHDTGQRRWLLCRSCNLGAGNFNHNPVLLRRMADWLEYAASHADATCTLTSKAIRWPRAASESRKAATAQSVAA